MKCNVLPLSTLLAIVLVQAAPSTSEMPGWGASEYSSNILGRDPNVVKDVIHLPRRKKNHEPRPLMQKRNPTPFVDISNISAYACEVSSPKYITNGYEDATMDQVGVILQKIADDGTGLPALPSCTGEETCWGVCTTIACHEQTLVLGCNNDPNEQVNLADRDRVALLKLGIGLAQVKCLWNSDDGTYGKGNGQVFFSQAFESSWNIILAGVENCDSAPNLRG